MRKRFSELELLLEYIGDYKNGLLIDVGSHQGSFSRAFAQKKWNVIAFEPEDNNRKAFIRNLMEYKKVKVFPFAVSDKEGNANFYKSNEHFGIHALKPFHKTHYYANKVKCIRLDNFLKVNLIKKVHFLKIDIEGADFLALKSFDFTKIKPRLIMVEFMDSRTKHIYGYTYADMINYMDKRGYSSFVSEWDKITEYAIEGQKSNQHSWIRCVKPEEINNSPAWGNLIFVPKNDELKFEKKLHEYIIRINNKSKVNILKNFLKPFSKRLWSKS